MKVLDLEENGKAYYRLAEANFELKKYKEAIFNVDKSL